MLRLLAAGLFLIGPGHLLANQQGSQPATRPLTQAEKNHAADVAGDIEIGKKLAEEAEKEYGLSTDEAAQERVRRIGADIAAIANSGPIKALWGDKRFSKFDYVYKVLKGDDVNAFSLPGGHIFVFQGLVNQVESDDELAGVIAHETAHAALRHVAWLEREEQKLTNVTLPIILLELLTGRGSSAPGTMEAASLIAQAKGSGWSVQAEKAADYGGFQFLLKSKYNPTGILSFMERMAEDERNGPSILWGIFETHPPSRERAEALIADLSAAGIPIRRSQVTTSFRTTVHPSDGGTVELTFGKRPLVKLAGGDALKRADAAADRLNAFFDETPEMFQLQAGPNGEIIGSGTTLLQISHDDAASAGTDVAELQDRTIQNMRNAMFSLGLRIWDLH